jgi:hypothetical protein
MAHDDFPDGNVIGAGTLGADGCRLWRAPSWEEIATAEAKEKRESKKTVSLSRFAPPVQRSTF